MPTTTRSPQTANLRRATQAWLPLAMISIATLGLLVSGCGSKPSRRTTDAPNTPGAPTDGQTAGTDGTAGDADTPVNGGRQGQVSTDGDGGTVSTNLVGDVERGSLGVGDPAPKLQIGAWVLGDKVGSFEDGKVYVVEFWATWCAPCRQSMPHLSDLQTKYGDQIKVVGVSDETAGEVARFLQEEQTAGGKKWIEVIKYSIALDDDQQTSVNYMLAANLEGIPNAFIVGKTGMVEWIGHPLGIDDALEAVVNDKWDREKAAREFKLESEITAAIQAKEPAIMKAHEAGKAAEGKGNAEEAEKQFDLALAKVDELLALIPEDASSPKLVGHRDQLNQAKQWLLREAGRTDALLAFQKTLIDQYWENPQLLDSIAWNMTDQEGADLDVAIKAAKRAVKLSDGKEPSPMDTLAKLYSLQDDLDSAIEWQTKAVAAAEPSPQLQKQLKSILEDYKKAKAGDGDKGDE